MRNTTTLATVALLLGCAHVASADAPLQLRRSYVETKNDQVMHAFLCFTPARTVEEQQDRLGQLRARDALLLPAGRAPYHRGAPDRGRVSAAASDGSGQIH